MAILEPGRKALIVAMDHGRTFGVMPGLENPGKIIDDAVAGGADAVMTTFGVVKKHKDRLIGRIPTILRLDGGPSAYREDWLEYTEWRLLHSVDDALFLGVDAVVLMAFIGSKVELETLRIVARVAGECARVRLPLLVEALPCPCERIPDPRSAEAMAGAARLGFEHGADAIKTYYTGTPESFRQVVTGCPAPVYIAGGPKMDTLKDAFQVVHDAVHTGASGVVFGRNIWQSPDVPGTIRALRHIIHDNGTVAEAVERCI